MGRLSAHQAGRGDCAASLERGRAGRPRTEVCETPCKVGLACGIWCKVFTTLHGMWFEQAERARILKTLVVVRATAALWNTFMARMVKSSKLGRDGEIGRAAWRGKC